MGAEVLAHVSTRESATDMDSIRRALGEETISYFGFSYGSELGATWATLFPDTVRAAVLDGASDPTAPDYENSVKQAAGFEASLDTFLAECADDTDCAFHNGGDPASALDELLVQLDESPLEVSSDRAPVNQGVALIAIANAMYGEPLWPALAEALAAAQQGDGEGLLAGYDEYFQRQSDGTYSNLLEAFVAISCLDSDPDEPQPGDAELIQRYQEVAPRLWPTFAADGFCETWPVAPAGSVEITGAGAGPIVVVGTTGDAATPLESSRAMADALEEGTLVIVEADQHTGYGVNECVVDAVDDYLIDLTVPEPGLVCS
ncbi:MAG TPA: alpha/beta hydrolase, partial [Ilumatobacteraceae bacterium]